MGQSFQFFLKDRLYFYFFISKPFEKRNPEISKEFQPQIFLDLLFRPPTKNEAFISSAESAEAPSFALRALEGPPFAFVHGLTPAVFCEGGQKFQKSLFLAQNGLFLNYW